MTKTNNILGNNIFVNTFCVHKPEIGITIVNLIENKYNERFTSFKRS